MKRSEMIYNIMSIMSDDIGYDMDEIEAEHLLDSIEKLGMLPPINNNNVYEQDTDNKNYENKVIKFFHSWDSK